MNRWGIHPARAGAGALSRPLTEAEADVLEGERAAATGGLGSLGAHGTHCPDGSPTLCANCGAEWRLNFDGQTRFFATPHSERPCCKDAAAGKRRTQENPWRPVD